MSEQTLNNRDETVVEMLPAEVAAPASEPDAVLPAEQLAAEEPLDPEALLEVRHLKKYFPAKKDFFGRPVSFVKAVDDVSFKIRPGTTLGIVGESGCGKTTLGRTILRLQPATDGQIFFDGKDINKLIAFCGLEPSTYQSGESEYTGHMVKHGSSYLRRHIMNSATAVLIHIPPLYDYYRKKRTEGKAHRVALSHLAKRLLKIIYTLEKNDLDFDIDKVR